MDYCLLEENHPDNTGVGLPGGLLEASLKILPCTTQKSLSLCHIRPFILLMAMVYQTRQVHDSLAYGLDISSIYSLQPLKLKWNLREHCFHSITKSSLSSIYSEWHS